MWSQNPDGDRRSVMHQLRMLLSSRHVTQVLILFIGMCFGALLEMVGIASVPFFVSLLVAPDAPISVLPFDLGKLLNAFRHKDNVVTVVAIGLAIFFLSKNTYLMLINYAEGRLLRNVSTSVSNRLYSAYMHSTYEMHLHRNPAQSIRNLTSESEQIRQLLRTNMQAFREFLVLVMIVLLLVFADPVASFAAIILLGLSAAGFFWAVRTRLTFSGLKAQQHRTQQLQWINQGLGSITLAKLLGKEKYLINGFSAQTFGKESELFLQKFLVTMPRLFLEVAALLAVMIVAGTITILERDQSTLLPTLALLSVSVVRMVPILVAITAAASQMEAGRAALNAVYGDLKLFETNVEQPHSNIDESEPQTSTLSENTLIRFDDVSFGFTDTEERALTHVTFDVRKGDSLGIVGASGSGKSTLVALMLGLLKPSSGDVVFRKSDRKSSTGIGYVPQQVYLLDMPVRDNIAFGIPHDQIEMSAVKAAAKAAQIDTFIESLSEGYDTQTGDRGVRFSGGQIQRLGIARALYHNPEILVLDEATSALDGETENSIIEAIEALKGERTLIIVAHRLNTMRHCDRIIKLEKGVLTADGRQEDFREFSSTN